MGDPIIEPLSSLKMREIQTIRRKRFKKAMSILIAVSDGNSYGVSYRWAGESNRYHIGRFCKTRRLAVIQARKINDLFLQRGSYIYRKVAYVSRIRDAWQTHQQRMICPIINGVYFRKRPRVSFLKEQRRLRSK